MVTNEKADFQQLMDSQIEKLLSSRIPVKLYVEENIKSVDDKYLIIGRITKTGVDYLVGVDRRFVVRGTTQFLIMNRGRVILKLEKRKTIRSGQGRRTRMYRSGGPRLPNRSGGPRLPKK